MPSTVLYSLTLGFSTGFPTICCATKAMPITIIIIDSVSVELLCKLTENH